MAKALVTGLCATFSLLDALVPDARLATLVGLAVHWKRVEF
jgi:hypothetical protein